MTISERALQLVKEGHVVGMGTGRAASAFVRVLGLRVKEGLKVRGVATSQATADLAREVGIELTSLDEVDRIDVAFDGADEIDPELNLIKGMGGALLREKIVASASELLVILGGPEKLVAVLGARGTLPVEVVPFGLSVCRRRLAAIGLPSTPRLVEGRLFTTDNGNNVLDCVVSSIPRPRELEQAVTSIPGVVGSGLFLGMAGLALIQDGPGVRELHRR